MKLSTYLVNSFTNELGCGNPAGVVIYENDLKIELMQKIASDIGKSETAFIKNVNDRTYEIRWFTPLKEISLCGHATMAAVKVIHELTGNCDLVFNYCDGILNAYTKEDDKIVIKFPVDLYKNIDADFRFTDFFGELAIIECIKGEKTGKVIIVVDESTKLEAILPNYDYMKRETGVFTKGIGITKKSRNYDFESRYFNPWFGVNEDPVTGTVHTVLAKYWSDKLNITNLKAFQCSYRPGIIMLEIENNMVNVMGEARIVVEGKFLI